jgi:hypothetical protein
LVPALKIMDASCEGACGYEDPLVVDVDHAVLSTIDWSPQRNLIAFSRGSPNSDIWVVRPDGTGLTNVTNTPDRAEWDPAWSPDGQKIAYAGLFPENFSTAPQGIGIMNADGTDKHQVTFPAQNGRSQDAGPNWSPDGTRIVFHTESALSDLYILDLAGSLKIAKVFDPKDSGFSGKFTVHYDCDDGTAHDGDVTLSAGGDTGIGGIPPGTACTVTEPSTPSPPTGWSFGPPAFEDGQDPMVDGTVTMGTDTATVTVTNSITRDTGSLKIAKVVTGGPAPFSGSFSFGVACASGFTATTTFTYPTPGNGTIANIPAGNCTVTETSKAAPPSGYVWASTTITPNPVSITKSAEATVTAFNPLVVNSGALTIGFWQNKNGQTIVQSGGDATKCAALAGWLKGSSVASPFASTPGPFKDAPTTCGASAALKKGATSSGVTGYVYEITKQATCSSSSKTCNSMLRAQMLATALNVYFSDSSLGGNKIGGFNGNGNSQQKVGDIRVDLSTVCKMIDGSGGTAICNGSYSLSQVLSVLGSGASSPMTVNAILSNVAGFANSDGSIWYGTSPTQQDKSKQVIAKDMFDSVNNRVVTIVQ